MDNHGLTKEQVDTIIYYYVEEQKGQAFCAKMAGTYPGKVKKVLEANGVPIRNKHDAIVLQNKARTYGVDKEYFDKQSPNMAWLLGFIASDGTVRKNRNEIKIGLAARDKEILERIKEEIKCERPLSEYETTDGYETCSLAWTCEQHKEALAKYSIVPEKTFILKPPYELDEKYWLDYIRGYFDGDGGINLIQNSNRRGNGNLRWQVCSATTEILNFILDVFEKHGVKRVNIQEQHRGENPLYSIQYSSVATRQIYQLLYSTNSTMYLKRKKDHYEEIMALVKPLNDIVLQETTTL